jgi:hypothetical protein
VGPVEMFMAVDDLLVLYLMSVRHPTMQNFPATITSARLISNSMLKVWGLQMAHQIHFAMEEEYSQHAHLKRRVIYGLNFLGSGSVAAIA